MGSFLRSVLSFLFGICTYVLATNSSSPVTWDKYSLSVNGQRLFVFSGEFHYQRLPVPELWLDVFEKLKANGFNAVSVYFFWSYHSASEGRYDFETGGHNIQRLFDYAKQSGIYVIARPGPYSNAETSAGGYPLWAANGLLGKERTSDPQYYNLWYPWMQKLGKIIAANQITNGGPVILVQHENELQELTYSANNTVVIYMEQITQAFADAGIVVPSTSNEKGMRSVSWSRDYKDVGGAVDIYGLDSYPGGLSCTDPDAGFKVVRTYYQWFQNYSFTQPEYLPEFQGGWFEPWGGYAYDDCSSNLEADFADVFYKNNVGSRVTLQNLYMAYGGTNWGYSAAPVVYTSYDYDAPLRETREVRDKLKQTKLLGLFTRVSSDVLETEMIGNGTHYTSDQSIFTWALRNPRTHAGFYVVSHDDTASRATTEFNISVETSKGPIEIPNVQLAGRQSRIIVTDYKLGNSKLLYCSADVLTYATLDVDVLALYLNVGQTGSFALTDASSLKFKVYGTSKVKTLRIGHGTMYKYTQGKGISVVKFSNGLLVYLLDKETAWNFFAPAQTSDPIVKPHQHIFVIGPYLVRAASFKGNSIEIVGDNEITTSIEVYTGDPSISSIKWNKKPIATERTPYGSLVGTVPGAEKIQIKLPKLTSWKSHDAIPEINPAYDDSRWTVCDKNTTVNAVAPLSLPVLYSGDYGYHAGPKLYRAHFQTSNVTGVNVTVQNGVAAGWSAWLNGQYVGGSPGNASLAATSAALEFHPDSLKKPTEDNVLTILTDYTGHDEDNVKPKGTQNPRGILGAVPQGAGSFTSWKIQGNAGGEKNIDPTRGPMNEGGLYAERMGWHLPGFRPDHSWDTRTPFEGVSGASGRFYITSFTLDIDRGLDVPLGLKVNASASVPAVVYIWMNGYQFGHYLPHIGPQSVFPFQPGIINTQKGKPNKLAISIWALEDQEAKLDQVELVTYGKYTSGFDFTKDWGYLQPGWQDRSGYA